MVPGQRFDKPGKSPFMDMDLVPVYADEAGAGGSVKISGDATQNFGIRLGRVEQRVLQQRFEAVGAVAADERLTELVQARVTGYVRQLAIRSTLEPVRAGQRLATIESPDWIGAQSDYLSLLQAESAYSESLRVAARQRLLLLGVPEAAVRELEQTRKVAATTPIYSPISGVVTELGVREGAAFMPGALLFRIQGLRTVWVNAQLPETQLHGAQVGARVTVRSKSWPQLAFPGRVAALLPQVDAATRTLTARIVVDNPQQKLSPGMFVSVALDVPAAAAQLVVPSEAVIDTGEQAVVIVARGDGSFDVATVTTGAEVGDLTPILSGLTAGQQIVLSGQFLIDSEASLKSTLTRLKGSAEPRP
jgi:Cu(I)/Ag(I) efflux system membrane fusion protein